MNLPIYTPPTPPEVAEETLIARDLLCGLAPENQRIIEHHYREFCKVWKNPRITPDAIIAAMGTDAWRMLAAARVSVQNICNIAAITGNTIDDVMPREWWYPPRNFVQHEDGSVTLDPPADGFDAWGNQIPQPEQTTEQ